LSEVHGLLNSSIGQYEPERLVLERVMAPLSSRPIPPASRRPHSPASIPTTPPCPECGSSDTDLAPMRLHTCDADVWVIC